MTRSFLRLGLVIAMAAMLCVLLGPRPAAAHIAGGASPTNARSVVTDTRPAVTGVGVTVGLGGQFVRVTNQGADEIVVLGYRGEPFLRLADDRVQVNPRSATAAETGQLRLVSRSADSSQGRRWVHLSDGDSVSWVDGRVDARSLPAGATDSWRLPLTVDGQRVTVLGTRTGLASPSPWPWLVALGVVAAAVATLGWVRDWHRPLAVVTVTAVVAFIAHMIGAGLAPQPGGPVAGWVVIALLGAFCLLVAGVTVVSTLRRTELAASRLPMAAVTLVLLAGSDISGLWNSQLPFTGPELLDRGLLVLVYGIALGMLVAGVRLSGSRGSQRAD